MRKRRPRRKGHVPERRSPRSISARRAKLGDGGGPPLLPAARRQGAKPVFPARRESGYRDYDDQAVAALSLISRARRLGYTLKEIGLYLKIPDEAGRTATLLRCIDGKLADFDALMADTQSRRGSLQALRRKLTG